MGWFRVRARVAVRAGVWVWVRVRARVYRFFTLALFFRCASHLYKRVCPSVGPSVGRSVPRFVLFGLSQL